MPDPGLTLPDLCSIRTAGGQEELAAAVRGGFSADGCPPGVDDRPHTGRPASTAPSACPPRRPCLPWRASRRMSPTGTPTRSSGPTARPGSPPGSSRSRSTASSSPVRWWCCTPPGTGCRYSPSPAGCSRWESPLPSPRTWPRAGPTVPPGRWSRPGRRSVSSARTSFLVWLIRASGAADREPSAAHPSTGAARRAAPRPVPASTVDGERPGGNERGTPGPAWRLAVRPPGTRPSPPADSVTMRRLRPAPAMTRRWPRTGSACRPATRCRNAGSPRCSGAHPAAGREPESPMHDRNRRSQTHRASRSRLSRKQGPPAVSPDAIVAVPGRSGTGAWRSARSALWVNLHAMSVKAWPGRASPPETTRPVRFFGETLDLEVAFDAGNTVEPTAGNGDRIQLFGPRPPLLRVLPQPRRQHRPAAQGGRPGTGEAELDLDGTCVPVAGAFRGARRHAGGYAGNRRCRW